MENKNTRKKNDTVYIYGLEEDYKIAHYFFITKDKLGAKSIASTAKYLKDTYPTVKTVYCVDNSREVFKAFMDLRDHGNQTENLVHFKMLLEEQGFQVAV